MDARPYAVGSIRETFEKFPGIGRVLPAMGYGGQMVRDLEETINATDADLVISGTPIDLNRVIKINKPIVRVHYELQEIGEPSLTSILKKKFM